MLEGGGEQWQVLRRGLCGGGTESHRELTEGGGPKLLGAVQQDLQPREILLLSILLHVVEPGQHIGCSALQLYATRIILGKPELGVHVS